MTETAKRYHGAGLSVIPVDAAKRPLCSEWQKENVFPNGQFNRAHGIGLVCGANSGHVEAIDIDCKYDLTGNLFDDYVSRVNQAMPGLPGRLVLEKSVNGGYHIIYRCNAMQGNLKLAQRHATDEEKARGDKIKVLIETRGQGGYIVVDPTPGYTILRGSLMTIPEISTEERDILLQIARSFNEVFKDAPDHRQLYTPAENPSPFQLYNEKADPVEVLCAHGWKVITQRDKFLHLRRPGTTESQWSASMNMETKQFHVFTQSSEFEEGKNYSPVAVFCLLEAGNDWKKCRQLLIEKGYGARSPHPQPLSEGEGSKALSEGKGKVLSFGEDLGEDCILHSNNTTTQRTPLSAGEELQKFEHLRISTHKPVARPEPIIQIQGVSICTPGNLVMITGAEKSAKTSFLNFCLSACIATANGFEGGHLIQVKPNPQAKAIIAIDTEQSYYDAYRNLEKGILKRVGREHPPVHFYLYSFRGLPIAECQLKLQQILKHAAEVHGGIFLCTIDGGGDFLSDTNDLKESTGRVAWFSQLALEYDTNIIQVVHLNPNSDKERGHYGSELRRKCESALLVKRDGDVSAVSPRLLRNGGVNDFAPMFYKYDKDKGYHVFAEGEVARSKDARLEELTELAEFVFKERINTSDAVALIIVAKKCSERKAYNLVTEIYNAGLTERTIEGRFFYYTLKSFIIPNAPDSDEETPF